VSLIHTIKAGPLGIRDFRLLLGGFAIGQILMPLQFLTQILWVQEQAPDDIWLILVALIGASRGIGALTFGLYGGALADRFNRRRLLLTLQILLVLITVLIALLMFSEISGLAGFGLFFVLTFLGAGLQAIDAPTRLAIVPDVLGPELTAAGMSLNQVAGQLSMPLAMFGAGFIIHELGFSGAYLLSALGHVVAFVFLVAMRYESHLRQAGSTRGRYGFGEALRDIREGLVYARGHPVVLWVILLLVTMMGLGFPATANLGPTWITTVVGVEVREVGYVVMTWGIGSLIAAIGLTWFSAVERRGRLIAVGALLFSGSFVVFVIDHTIINAVIGNLGIGAGMTITTVSSTILIQKLVPNEVRGRIMSIFQLNMGFAQLMTMPIAVLGQWLTLPVLFPLLAFATLAVVVVILFSKRQIVRA
jgi:predicted MFS family arabinose efflux permease